MNCDYLSMHTDEDNDIEKWIIKIRYTNIILYENKNYILTLINGIYISLILHQKLYIHRRDGRIRFVFKLFYKEKEISN